MSDTYTCLQVEAALCLWEWIDACTMSRSDEHQQLRAYRDQHGTSAMRHECIGLASYCLEVYDLLPAEARDCRPYDWEIIPAIASTINWTVSPPARMVPADAARVAAGLLTTETREKRPT